MMITKLLTPYLLPFPSYGWLLVEFLLTTGGRFTLMPSLGVMPCEYPDKPYLPRNYNDCPTCRRWRPHYRGQNTGTWRMDRGTDRDGHTACAISVLHCGQCGGAVKVILVFHSDDWWHRSTTQCRHRDVTKIFLVGGLKPARSASRGVLGEGVAIIPQ